MRGARSPLPTCMPLRLAQGQVNLYFNFIMRCVHYVLKEVLNCLLTIECSAGHWELIIKVHLSVLMNVPMSQGNKVTFQKVYVLRSLTV